MKRIQSLVLGLVLASFTPATCLAQAEQKTAGEDMKEAGKSAKKAAKKTGSAVKKGTKKAANKAAEKTGEGAAKVKDATRP